MGDTFLPWVILAVFVCLMLSSSGDGLEKTDVSEKRKPHSGKVFFWFFSLQV